MRNQDAVIITVGHEKYKKLKLMDWERLLPVNGILIDVKSIVKKNELDSLNIMHWRL